MIRVTLKGDVPAWCADAGRHSIKIYIDDTKFVNVDDELIRKIAVHHTRQCNDCTFKGIERVEVVEDSFRCHWSDIIYKGLKAYYDRYFKRYTFSYIVN